MTAVELKTMLVRLKELINDNCGLLKQAEKKLADGYDGCVESAQLDMAEAVRNQIQYVKKYDVTGRLVSQTQMLRDIHHKLLKGPVKESCKKAFSCYSTFLSDALNGIDSRIVKAVGGAVGFTAWIAKFIFTGDVKVLDNIQGGARWATWFYAPVKATMKMVLDKGGRRHLGTICKGVWMNGRRAAEEVWGKTKSICQTVASSTVKVIQSGYAVAKQVSTGFVESIKSVGRAAGASIRNGVHALGRGIRWLFA